jgi:hypothetical protein
VVSPFLQKISKECILCTYGTHVFFFCGTHQNFIIQGPLSDISSQDDIVMLYKRGITLNAIVQHFISCFMSELDPDIMVKDWPEDFTWQELFLYQNQVVSSTL